MSSKKESYKGFLSDETINEEVHNLKVHGYLSSDGEKAFKVLYDGLYPLVFSSLGKRHNPFDAENLTQETFIAAMRSIDKFNERTNFRAWLLAIAQHKSVDFLRKTGGRSSRGQKKPSFLQFSQIKDGEDDLIDLPDPYVHPLKEENRLEPDELSDAVENLPGPQRKVIQLGLEGLSTVEIERRLGVTYSAVIKSRSKAMKKLRKRFR